MSRVKQLVGGMLPSIVIPAEAGISGGGEMRLPQEPPEIPAFAGMTGIGGDGL